MIYTALASGNLYTDVALGPTQCTGSCATNCVNYWNSCIASCNGSKLFFRWAKKIFLDFYCNFMTCLKYYSQGTSVCLFHFTRLETIANFFGEYPGKSPCKYRSQLIRCAGFFDVDDESLKGSKNLISINLCLRGDEHRCRVQLPSFLVSLRKIER